jgi:V/A-type H+-transporting ATPase subunit A
MSDGTGTARVKEISGTFVVAEADSLFRTSVRLFEAARVGKNRLLGEVLEIRNGEIAIQLYENAAGLSVGEEIHFAGAGLSVDLGPGFLGGAVNGLGLSFGKAGEAELCLERGFRGRSTAPQAEKRWHFRPSAREGERVEPGSVLGTADGGPFLHRVTVPPSCAFFEPSAVEWIAPEGDYTAREDICRLSNGKGLSMTQRWEIRVPRPIRKRLSPDGPFVTGQSVLDTLFPLALGGTAALSGEPGTGKTLLLRSLAQCRGADAVVFILCGERGMEAAELLESLSKIKAADARREGSLQGFSLMERTALVVSTSDMPLATREASVCLGMTLAEYYRDMGYNAAVMLDSASRCAEALSETGARLRKTGHSEYGMSRLTACLERAGRAEILGTSPEGARRGSVTLIRTESDPPALLAPPGAFWKLDRRSAQACRFPALDISRSHSLYQSALPEPPAREIPPAEAAS